MSSVAAQPDLKCLVERESNRRDDADSSEVSVPPAEGETVHATACAQAVVGEINRKSTRLNSSHGYISYAVFCLKKKKKTDVNHASHTHCILDQARHRY